MSLKKNMNSYASKLNLLHDFQHYQTYKQKIKGKRASNKKPIKKKVAKKQKIKKRKKGKKIIIKKNSINIEEYELRWTKIVIHNNLFIRGFYFYKIKTFLII